MQVQLPQFAQIFQHSHVSRHLRTTELYHSEALEVLERRDVASDARAAQAQLLQMFQLAECCEVTTHLGAGETQVSEALHVLQRSNVPR